MTDAVEASWSESDLSILMNRYPRIAINALTIAGKRLQEVQERLRELATQPVERRVAQMLLRLSGQFGQKTADGRTIGIPLRRKDIADICGTTLFSVSRVLTSWEKAGWLITRDQYLTIAKLSEIQRVGDKDGS
jgi:CRP-like cAMP-binding protein